MSRKKIKRIGILFGLIVAWMILIGRNQTAYASEEDWPMMMPGGSWFDLEVLNINEVNIKSIDFYDSYIPNGTEISLCNVDVEKKGRIKAYLSSNRKRIVIAGDGSGGILANSDCSNMFKVFSSVKEINNLSIIDTSNTTNMKSMFENCCYLQEIDVSGFDTSNVTDMSYMFQNCCSLEMIDVEKWKIEKVSNTSFMFHNCAGLISLNFSKMEDSSLRNMSNMFSDCYELSHIEVKGLNTKYVTDMSGLFQNCYSLSELEISSWNTNNLTNIQFMFSGCMFVDLDLNFMSTKKVNNFSGAFKDCSSLTNLKIDSWEMGTATNVSAMFSGCSQLKSVDFHLNGYDVQSLAYLFENCSQLREIDISGIGGYKLNSVSKMLEGCNKLEHINIGFYLGNILDDEAADIFGSGVYPELKSIKLPRGVKTNTKLPSVSKGQFYDGENEITYMPKNQTYSKRLFVVHHMIFCDSENKTIIKDVLINRGECMPIPEHPTKTSPAFRYQFTGWVGEDRSPYDFSQAIYSNQMIYASWSKEEIRYLVSFDPDNGNPVATCSVAYRGRVSEPEQPVKNPIDNKEFRFLGWFLNGEKFDFLSEILEDIRLKAVWEEILIYEPEEESGGSQTPGEVEENQIESEKEENTEEENKETEESNIENTNNTEIVVSEKDTTEKESTGKDNTDNNKTNIENSKDKTKEEKVDSDRDKSEQKGEQTPGEEQKPREETDDINSDNTSGNSNGKSGSSTGGDSSSGAGTSTGSGSSTGTGSSGSNSSSSGSSSGGGRNSSDSGGGSSGGGGGSSGGGGGSYVSNGRTPSGPKITVAGSTSTYSEFWYTDNNGNWRIRGKDGKMITSCWLCDDAVASNGKEVWYLIGSNGEMLSCGLVQDNTGNFYSLEMTHNGYFGMLRYKNGFYKCGNEMLYITFEHSHNGSFGAITNKEALESLKKQYGITRFPIGNENCIYTSTF